MNRPNHASRPENSGRVKNMDRTEPILPQPEPVTINPQRSALLVLDGSQRWGNPEMACHKLVPGMSKFLDRAREAGIPIVFTISAGLRGTPEGQVYTGLKRRPSEPVIFPDGFNKFTGGELESFLNLYGPDTLIITGYRSNISVLNTATKATRELKYKVVIPIDGIIAITDYEQEYTLFQFTVLPAQANELFTFTTLDMISFLSER
jgi:nicotinamidase-related amidase